MRDTVSETALINSNVFSNLYSLPNGPQMMGDGLLSKRSPDKNQRLAMINGIYHVKHSVRNSLDNLNV